MTAKIIPFPTPKKEESLDAINWPWNFDDTIQFSFSVEDSDFFIVDTPVFNAVDFELSCINADLSRELSKVSDEQAEFVLKQLRKILNNLRQDS